MKGMLRLSLQEMEEMLTKKPVMNKKDLGYSLYHTTFETVIDEPICKGHTKSIKIRDGVTFLQLQLTFLQDTEVEMMSVHPQVGFCFCLKGLTTAYVHNRNGGDGADLLCS